MQLPMRNPPVPHNGSIQGLLHGAGIKLSADLHMAGGEQKSDVDDASSTDETVLAEPGSPYDLVAPVPPPTDATAAQMLTEQAVSQINAALEHTDHAQ
eukprot:scaffold80504_cov72-Phaeocystis_antarctica.AAC.1